MKENIKPLEYHIGIFDEFKSNKNLYDWCERFPETMWGLGFDLAPPDALEIALKKTGLKVEPAKNKHDEYRNLLYILEHSDRKTIGDLLFSYWRYFTHWNLYGYDKYDSDLCIRILNLLENTYSEKY